MISRLLRLLTAGVAIGVVPAAAQDLVSPFHGGEWGAHIAVNGLTFTNVDIMRFTAPTRAWVLSVGAGATDQRISEAGFPTFTSQRGTSLAVSAQRRFFRTLAPRASVYVSPGLSGSASHNCGAATPGSPVLCDTQWQVGALVEFGGEYVIGQHFGIGARYSATLNYFHQALTGGGGTLHEAIANLSSAGVFVSLFL